MYSAIVELKQYFFCYIATVHNVIFFFFLILHSHYFFYLLFFMHFIFLSPCLSPHCLSISSFFLHRPIADLHEPSRHRLIAVELTHFSLSSLFSSIWLVFRLCVSGCTCVSGLSALCFGLFSALCFGLCLGCAGFLFWAWVSVLVC